MRSQIRVLSVVAVVGVVVMAWPTSAGAEGVTYYEHVLPILQENCQTCHRPSGQNITGIIAPMSLMSFEETRPWARAVAQKVASREMPPWYSSAPKGVYSNERGLTDAEIETIVAWVNEGAPAGDRALAPPPLVFPEEASGGWSLGTPDFVVKMERYLVPDEAYDVQTTFRTKIPDEFVPEEGLWVRGWEGRAGTNGDRVHHYCSGIEAPGAEISSDGNEGEAAEGGGSLGCVSAGTEARLLPEGWGMFIERGSSVRYSMHYNKEPGPGTAFYNQAEMGFHVAKGAVKHAYKNDSIGNRGYMIPAHRANYRVGSGRMLERDTLVINWWPHAHLRATAARYVATYPDGTTELLLDVPKYDQSWQETYWYKEPKFLPKGTMIDVSFWYDNTSERGIRRGFDADQALGFGPRTNDEMQLGFIGYVELEPDEADSSQN